MFVNKKIYLTFSFICLFLTSWSQVDSGMISRYPFDGDLNDVEGSNNATNSGATQTTDRFGNASSAYSVSGGNYINMQGGQTGETTDFNMGTGSFSFSIWFKRSGSMSSYGYIIGKRAYQNACSPTDPVYALAYQASTNKAFIYWRFDDLTYNTGWGDWPATTVSSNEWHHAVGVFDRNTTSGGVRLYIDGQLVDEKTSIRSYPTGLLDATSCNNPPQHGDFIVGKSILFNEYFGGDVDEVRIYDRALNEDEVFALYNEMKDIPDADWTVPTGGTVNSGVLSGNSLSSQRFTLTEPIAFPWCYTHIGRSTSIAGKTYFGSGGDCPLGGCWVDYGLTVGNDEYYIRVTEDNIISVKNGVFVQSTPTTNVDGDWFKLALASDNTIKLYKNGSSSEIPGISLTMDSYGEGNFFVTTGGNSTSLRVPLLAFPCQTVDRPAVYNKLSDKLSGSYYRAFEKKLYFYYDEEYRADANLSFKVLNKQHNDVTPASTALENIDDSNNPSKRYGTNRYKMDCSSLTVGEYYILEVENDKSEKKYLRFKVEQ